jgi:hypothetical protein
MLFSELRRYGEQARFPGELDTAEDALTWIFLKGPSRKGSSTPYQYYLNSSYGITGQSPQRFQSHCLAGVTIAIARRLPYAYRCWSIKIS